MTKILIAGLKEPPGGVENAVLAYTENFDKNEITSDFAFVCGEVSFRDRINGSVYYLPNRIKHPVLYRKKLRKIFRSEKYDALWCNYSGLTNIDFLKAAKKAGVPVRIVHAHTAQHSWGNELMRYLVPFFHNKNQRVVDRYTTHYRACSKNAAAFMFGENLAEKAEIIPNTVDTDKFIKDDTVRRNVLTEFSIPEGAPVIGHVGRMCKEKNQSFLLDIMKEVVNLNSSARLLFVGDGELRDSVISHAEELGIRDNVIFTLSRKDVPRLLQAMDAFALPSLTEGFPVTLVEAQAADIPCVVSSEAIIRETDITGTTAFISLKEDTSVWAKALLDACEMKLSGGAQRVKEAGYDCKTEAIKLQNFFKGA